MICPDCPLYSRCPGPDDEECPHYEELKDNNEGLSDEDREYMFKEYNDEQFHNDETANIPPSRDEQILTLYFMKRKKQVEIAEILSISQSCVSKVVIKYRPIIARVVKSSLQ